MGFQAGNHENDDNVQKEKVTGERTMNRNSRHTEREEREDGPHQPYGNQSNAGRGGNVFRGGNRMGDGTPSSYLGRTFMPGMSDNIVDNLAKKLEDKFKELRMPDGKMSANTRFRSISARLIDEDISCVLAHLEFNAAGGERVVAVRAILVYAGESIKRKRVLRERGQEPMNVPVRAADAGTSEYWDKIINVALPNLATNVVIAPAGMETITKDFDTQNDDHIELLLGSTISSIEDVIEPYVSGDCFDATALAAEGYYSKVTPIISDEQHYNLTGQPIRGDIQIPWLSCYGSQGRYDNDNYKETEFGRVMGYIDLVPLELKSNRYSNRSEEMEASYEPVFVITHCGPVDSWGAATLEVAMNILSGAYSATEGNFWMGVWQPATDDAGGMRALGGLGWHSTFGAEIKDIDSASTTQRDVNDLMCALLSTPKGMSTPTPAFAIDLDPSQDKSGVVSTLLAAANGDINANKLIVEAVTNLFGGVFDWDPEVSIIEDSGVMISIGEWEDSAGVKRDAREFDTQALLNRLDGNMDYFWDVMDTFGEGGDPLYMMLKREQLLNAIMGGTIRNTSYAFRAFFNPDFFIAMNDAAIEAKVAPRVEGVGYDMGHRYNSAMTGRQVSRNAKSYRGSSSRRDSRYTRDSSDYGFRRHFTR